MYMFVLMWPLKDKEKNLSKLGTKAMASMVMLTGRKNTKDKGNNLPYLHQFFLIFSVF